MKFNLCNVAFPIGNYDFRILAIEYGQIYRPIPKHYHSKDSYELHYVTSGTGILIGNSISYPISANTLYMTGPFIEHTQIPYASDAITEYCIYIQVSPNCSTQTNNNSETELVRIFRENTFWIGNDTQQLQFIFQSLFEELKQEKIGFSIQIESLLRQLVVKLVRNYQRISESNNPSFHTPQHSNISMIENPYLVELAFLDEYSSITLNELAQRFNTSTRQMERFLQKHYGKSFVQIKKEARMAAAHFFLTSSDQSISQISEKIGYSCVEHFSTAFKYHYGCSPSIYRKKYNQGEIVYE